MPIPMKKFTVITLREYEDLVLRGIEKVGAVELKEVTGAEFESLRPEVAKERVDYKALWEKFRSACEAVGERQGIEPIKVEKSAAEIREFTLEPERKVGEFLERLKGAEERLNEAKGQLEEAKKRSEGLERTKEILQKIKVPRLEVSADRVTRAGLASKANVPSLEKYTNLIEDVTCHTFPISKEESFVVLSGPIARQTWIEAVFLVFDIEEMERAPTADEMEEVKRAIGEAEEEVDAKAEEVGKILGEAEVLKHPLRLRAQFSDVLPKVLRSRTTSVIQGWIPTQKVSELKSLFAKAEEEATGCLVARFEDPSQGEKAPSLMRNPEVVKPYEFLTSMRGYPSYGEIDPTLISIIIYSMMFGVMFGDVGQGTVLIAVGLIIRRLFRPKGGLGKAVGNMFIPMGIASTIFGFLYGEVFLMEHVIEPILFSPLESLTSMMLLAIYIAFAELSLGFVIAAVNSFRAGDKLGGLLGAHGLGALVFYVGFMLMFKGILDAGMNIMAIFTPWPMIVPVIGLVMITMAPILKREGFGKAIGDLLIIVIELLCNTFSFIRLAAFAMAHACLGIAAHALTGALGLFGPVMANGIAMTFELMSSAVQSLRLLYYEFMSKFYHGTGRRFKPLL